MQLWGLLLVVGACHTAKSIPLDIAPTLIPQVPVVAKWNWSTIPTAFHGANKSGYYTSDTIATLATFHMVTVEKWYTPCASQGPTQGPPSCAVEEKIEGLLAKINAINPNTIGILYLNSMFDFQFYTLHGLLLEAEQRGMTSFLRDEHGEILSLCNDGDVYCNITTFDWTQPHVRDLWLETMTNATATGSVDGIFADHSAQEHIQIGAPTNGQKPNQLCNGVAHKGRQCYNFTAEFTASFNSWHTWMTNKSQDMLSKSTNGPVINGPHARYQTACTFDDIRETIAAGYVYIEVNKGFDPHSPGEDCIAAFLASVEEGIYLTHFSAIPYAFAEQSYPLGAPDGPAKEITPGSEVWHRTFASGTEVWFDNNKGKQNGTVKWGGGQPPPPAPPSPPAPQPQPPAQCGKLHHNTGIKGDDVDVQGAASVAECCAMCTANAKCTQWAWHDEQRPALCHMHSAAGEIDVKRGCYAGVMNRTAHISV
eukprot:m.302708 g.302708  ORF g.302708 m.302708 type:complete len:480 (-) comp20150_c0_seq1:280-1719(-)